MRRFFAALCLFSLFTACLFAQGLNTTATSQDWEEINFETNSAVLSDGYPSLLRLAELLQKNPDHRVNVVGYGDPGQNQRAAEKLGQRRADAVKAFLQKYGANPNQVTTSTQGNRNPKVPNTSREGRFINRRVEMAVTDAQGKTVGAGGVAQAINAFPEEMKKCCDDILKRLDRLDEIADLLKGMKGENDALRKELADLRGQQQALDAYVKGLPKPLTREETSNIVDTRTAEQIERARMPRFSILGLNAGADSNGELTFTGRGRFFAPFKEQFAFQASGEYMYFRDRQEGQMDFGLVNRFASRGQVGLFSSFKHINFSPRQSRDLFSGEVIDIGSQLPGGSTNRPLDGGALLGQASVTMDYIFSRGKIGIFGSKGFLNNSVVTSYALNQNVFEEVYARTIDQVGVSTTVGLMGDVYAEGNFGYLKSRGYADRPGGTLRFVFPIADRFAFTLEGGMNETLLTRSNNGRVVAGFQFGNFMRPKDYLEGYNGIQHAVPVDVPRVRYELLTRRVRTGNGAPVADAGPDQIGIAPGTVTLNGTGSFDPEGDPIRYQWTQIAGPSVSLSGMNNATATFTAAEGQTYSFRLTVTDDKGAQGIARTTVTVRAAATPQQVQIIRFQASPSNIRPGQTSNIDWQVLNADSVTIEGLGTVDARNGTRTVSPTQTTTYRLIARNAAGEATATTTIVVEQAPAASFLTCTASPTNITAGESATINYSTQNADTVSISPGVGNVASAGQQVVTPTETTTYTLTATNPRGPVTCQVTVTVNPRGEVPRVVNFMANPMTITAGDQSTLSWSVEGAETVSISTLGNVNPTGTRAVTPTTTTTYTLTATNRFGTTTATATITVNPAGPGPGPGPTNPTLTACTATPGTSPSPGSPVVLRYTATNATAVSITGVTGATVAGPVTVNPTQNTTYTITATGAQGTTPATCTVAVTVTQPQPPTAIITGPSTVETIYRQITLDASTSTNPGGGALTYIWTPLSTGAAVLDQGQAQTRVIIGGLSGPYIFRLTVRNAAGLEDSTTVTVNFRSVTVP
jgi:hypothetical protein